MSHTAYLTRLRRAFLLRVHPDRFLDPKIRMQQASLVKALSNRMSQSDFTAWLQHQRHFDSRVSTLNVSQRSLTEDGPLTDGYEYCMEKRDGTIFQSTLSLNQSVDQILHSMATALKKWGAASLPLPPSAPAHSESLHDVRKIHHQEQRHPPSPEWRHNKNDAFDSRYNVRSNRGRDLQSFLDGKGLVDEIRERKAARMDAHAVAYQVRRMFQFAAVDATQTQWSSTSVAILLRRLVSFHHELSSRLNVTSFYPLRLVFSNHETPDDPTSCLDMYGGVLLLNPASTSIQWLQTMQLVTPGRLQEVRYHRTTILERTTAVQGRLGIKLRKGHTCSSQEYNAFLERVVTTPIDDGVEERKSVDHDVALPMLNPLQAIVESESSCRRAKVTSAGHIQLGAGMSAVECFNSIVRLSHLARDRAQNDQAVSVRCRDMSTTIQNQLGIEKVYRTTNAVSHDEFVHCLSRVLGLVVDNGGTHPRWVQKLAGNTLGIAAHGQFCHLSDDGSVVIPHNWF